MSRFFGLNGVLPYPGLCNTLAGGDSLRQGALAVTGDTQETAREKSCFLTHQAVCVPVGYPGVSLLPANRADGRNVWFGTPALRRSIEPAPRSTGRVTNCRPDRFSLVIVCEAVVSDRFFVGVWPEAILSSR